MPVFKFPRRTLQQHPRAIAKSLLRNAPRGVPHVEPTSPLDVWTPGFSGQGALDFLEQEGVRTPEKPDNDPDMPPDVTVISSEELGSLYAHFVSFTEWLEGKVALAEISAEEDQAYLEHVDAEVRLMKSGTVADKQAKTLQDPRYIEFEMKALESKARAKLLRARLRGYERCSGALSREITRRNPRSDNE